jgi:putative transposase
LKPTRGLSPIGTYFVTATTWGRRSLFQSERLAQLFMETIYDYRSQSKYSLHAFVLMPDHFHLLITPALGITIERAMQYIKGGYSHRVRVEMNSPMEIWERGFTDHRIRDEQDFFTHRAYILSNPMSKFLAERAEDYAYCSAYPGRELDSWPSAAKAAASG